jgi:opine dehydrogenase
MTSDLSLEPIAIVGAGNGGCAAAVDLSLRGFDVRLYGRSPSTIQPLQARGGIDYEGIFGEGFAKIPLITTDAGEAIRGARTILLMGPTQAHENMATVVAPHLTPDHIVFAAPGHTVTLLAHTLRRMGHKNPITCEAATLPYICRKTAVDRIRVSRKSGRLRFAAFPAYRTEDLLEKLLPLFPMLVPAGSVLETVFYYTNAIHHPPALLCNIGRVESTGGDYYHYYDGITPSVGRIIDALDQERIQLGAALGIEVPRLSEYFFQMSYTNEAGRDGGTAYDVFHNSEPNRWIRAPASIDHRFFNEDIPFGLVPLTELGKLAGTPMPISRAVILLSEIATGRAYQETGLTLERMGIAGMSVQELKRLLERGYE